MLYRSGILQRSRHLQTCSLASNIPGVTQEQIDAAREEVARDMGW
jgi:hypothetical protein